MAKRSAKSERKPRKQDPTAEAAPIQRYIESSALVAAILESDSAARTSIRAPGQRVTSALTLTEATRAIHRARVLGRITVTQQRQALVALARFMRRCYIVSVTDTILERAARPFPAEPVRTLDAIHLSTVEALGGAPALLTIVSRDLRIQENAVAMGYLVE